jgi:hypothetical protein
MKTIKRHYDDKNKQLSPKSGHSWGEVITLWFIPDLHKWCGDLILKTEILRTDKVGQS